MRVHHIRAACEYIILFLFKRLGDRKRRIDLLTFAVARSRASGCHGSRACLERDRIDRAPERLLPGTTTMRNIARLACILPLLTYLFDAIKQKF